MKKLTALITAIIMMLSSAAIFAADEELCMTAEYIVTAVSSPSVATVGGEWSVIGLARSDFSAEDGYFEKYYADLENKLKSNGGVLHKRKYTEYSRAVIAVSAIGRDPRSVAGYDLTLPLTDFEAVTRQGINGPVWALIALNSCGFSDEPLKERYISEILKREKQSGGWSLSERADAEADITAMALTALSFCKERADASAAIDRAVNFLSEIQTENGGYMSGGEETAESAAQVLVAMSALEISADDGRFVKNGKSVKDNMLSFYNADGSFSHTDEPNLMATEQCFYALVAEKRAREGKTALFDISGETKVCVPDILYKEKSFDDIREHEYRYAIEALAERGIISGMTDSAFCPDETLSRAAFTAIIVRALGLSESGAVSFSDVAESDWFYPYVKAAYSAGIIKGVSESEFDPYGTLTFEQVELMLFRAASLLGTTYVKNKVGASDAIKRGETAEMLYGLLKGACLL